MGIRYEKKDGKLIEYLSETVCFRIEDRFEAIHALPLLAALQAYVHDAQAKTESWNKIYKQNRVYDLTIHLDIRDSEVKDFLARYLGRDLVHPSALVWVPDPVYKLENFDYYVDITLEKVMDIIRAGNLHMHQGFSILIGCAATSLPDISVKESSFSSGQLLLVDSPFNTLTLDMELALKEKFSKVVRLNSEFYDNCNEEVLDLVRSSEAVFGIRGFATYAGSCLKKPVVELVEDNFWLLSQWSNPYYAPFCENKFTMKGVERLWEMVRLFRASFTSNQTQEILTPIE